ncbi:MAG: amino acid adenylation domain-containing protein, partial [Alteromonadaceae bacterium]|nr:amino acid adenylation domain-containing protein [Alteromonadaceae bacterium]
MSFEDVLLEASDQGVFFYLKNDKLTYKVKKNTLSAELKAKIKQYRVEIKVYLESTAKKNHFILPKVTPADRTKALLPSFSQQRLWFIDQLEGSLHYNIQGRMVIEGFFNEKAFKQALQSLLDRHEVLRTHFTTLSGETQQVIVNDYTLPLTIHDLSQLTDEEKENRLQQVKKDDALSPFNLSEDLMIRVHLFTLSSNIHLIFYTMHHIASDGWSSGILRRELRVLYEAYSQQKDNPLPPLTLQYADYAQWQRQWLQGDVLSKHLHYWKEQLAGIPQLHKLTLDKPRPLEQIYQGRSFNQVLNKSLTKKISTLCDQHSVTLFMFLETAFTVLMSRYSNETDIVIGTPIAGREHSDVEQLIGFFINSLVLRTDLSNNPTFSELLKANKQTILDAYSHQHIPFEMLVEELHPERNMSHNALFQLLFVVQNNENDLPDIPLESLAHGEQGLSPVTNLNIRFDIAIHVAEVGEGLLVNWSFRDSLFDHDTIRRMAVNYEVLLESIIEGITEQERAQAIEPNISDLVLLTEVEQDTLLVEWNATQADYPQNKCIQELFEEQVERVPQNTAVIFEDKEMTYRELNERSNQLAHYLIAQGVKPDSIVALSVERSFETMVGLLGILKAGAAYVPLDPHYPKSRLAFMLEDCGTNLVLTQSSFVDQLATDQQQVICLDAPELKSTLSHHIVSNPRVSDLALTPKNLAYVIYTSGSTGKPKGVAVTHANVCNFIHCASELFLTDAITGSVVSSPLAFDATVQSLYVPLCAGKYVEFLPENEQLLSNLADYLIDDEDSLLFKITPSHLKALSNQAFVEKNPAAKHVIVIAGEQLTKDTLRPWLDLLPGSTFINEYGPTEATVGSCTYKVTQGLDFRSSGQGVPIGKPLANVQFYVLDKHLCLQPIGAAGELYIGGAGLAKEYLHQPQLTKEKFISNPFSDKPEDYLYKTGDLVRYLADGNVEFLRRIDEQVKIRGFRIELGEIESLLFQHEAVLESVVLAKENEQGEQRLIAYIVLESLMEATPAKGDTQIQDESIDGESETEEQAIDYQSLLRSYLLDLLPEYMVPAAYVFIKSLPLTPSGKIDKKALPDPDQDAYAQTDYIAPENAMEVLLVELWAELLQLEPEYISTSANFFALGGHSLLIMKLIAKLQERDLYTDVKTLFNASTLAELAESLGSSNEDLRPFISPPNLIPDDCQQITPNLLPLVDLSEFEIAQIVLKIPGGTENIQDIYPLVPLQQGILFHHMLAPEQDPYVLDKMFIIEHKDLVEQLLVALQCVINRHDVLRTAIITEGVSSPVQVVQRQAKVQVHHINLESDAEVVQNPLSLRDQLPAMVMSEAPLLRVLVASTKGQAPYYFHQQYHHIISDHVGNDVLWSEVEAILSGCIEELPQPAPYRDFVAQVIEQSRKLDAQTYFSEQLSDITEPTLPFGLIDVRGNGQEVARARETLAPNLSQNIREVARNLRMSPASLFHSAWAMVVSACGGCDDVVFGTVLSGRLQGTAGAERMLGLFINTLPVRVKLAGYSPEEFVKETDKTLKTLLNYEQASLAQAQNCSGVDNGTPLFNSILNFRHSSNGSSSANENADKAAIRGAGGGEGKNNYPISIAVSDLGNDFSIKATIALGVEAERVLSYLVTAITNLTDALQGSEESYISQLSILPALERQQMLDDWNSTQVDYPQKNCIHELFEEQVERTPDNIAVVFEDVKLTYRELNKRSNQLAHYLVEQGVKPDSLVALSVERSIETMVALLGILKSGGAYVPLDPSYPAARLTYMLEDCGAKFILTQSELLESLTVDHQQIICLDEPEFQSILSNCASTNLVASSLMLEPDHLAYVIYTSGSTGRPKGVAVNHASVCNFLFCARDLFLTETIKGSVVSSPLAFDATVQSLYVPLCAGKYVKLLPENEDMFYSLAACLMNEEDDLLFKITPTHLKALSNQTIVKTNLEAKHVVVVAGEQLTKDTLQPWLELLPGATFINEYGPTEATVGSCTYKVIQGLDFGSGGQGVPIGKPLANVQFYVLDKHLSLQPIGVAGELYIGGAGLAREYLHQPELTKEKFISNPFSDKPEDRLYQTGDLVRYLADGNVEFLGRIDSQVKLRGFRIELEEIENRLLQHEIVSESVVVARNNEEGDKRLVAYVVLTNKDEFKQINADSNNESIDYRTRLRTYLQEALPEYMVPAAYVSLDVMPLTPNGKIDKESLVDPEVHAYAQTAYVAPTTTTENLLVEFWGRLLQLETENISTTANFFALGGHSLLVMRLIPLLQEHGIHTDVRTVVNASSLADLANSLDNAVDGENVFVAPKNLIPEGCEQIVPDLLPLVDLNLSEIEHIISKVPGGAANIKDIYPLAPLQEGILFHHLLDPERDPYVLNNMFVIEHKSLVDRLLAALQFVVDRHDVLRTAIITEGVPIPVQVVLRKATFQVHHITLDPDTELESQVKGLKYSLSGMILSKAPLLRVLVASAGEGMPSYFLIQTHHLITDHIGSAILRAETDAFLRGEADKLLPSVSYREFVAHALHQAKHSDAQAYFTEQLGDISDSTLPFGLANVRGDGRKLERASEVLSPKLSKSIRKVAQRLHMSPASVFHAAWALVVGACSGRNDVVFGTVLSGRLQGTAGTERMMGLCINTLPVRANLKGRNVRQVVEEIDGVLKTLLNYEQTSLAEAQSCSGLSNEIPLFNALLNYRHSHKADSTTTTPQQGTGITNMGGEERTNYPFELAVSDWGEEFSIYAIIEHGIEAERVINYFVTTMSSLVDALTYSEEMPIAKVSILPTSERQQMVQNWNNTQAEYPQDKCIHQMFESQVEMSPDAVALVFEDKQLSYGELNRRSNQLAHYLIEQGVGLEDRVGIYIERSLEMVIGILAILKAGGCYVPLDPQYPKKRLAYIIEDSGIALIVTESA